MREREVITNIHSRIYIYIHTYIPSLLASSGNELMPRLTYYFYFPPLRYPTLNLFPLPVTQSKTVNDDRYNFLPPFFSFYKNISKRISDLRSRTRSPFLILKLQNVKFSTPAILDYFTHHTLRYKSMNTVLEHSEGKGASEKPRRNVSSLIDAIRRRRFATLSTASGTRETKGKDLEVARTPPRKMENGFFVAQEITNREYDLRFDRACNAAAI